MALNYEEARTALTKVYRDQDDVAFEVIREFINDVEKLMKRNSIRQIPAICRPFDEGD